MDQHETDFAPRLDAQTALLWAACIGGALTEQELAELASSVGIRRGRLTERFDCFAKTATSSKLASDLRVHSANFFAEKAAH